MKGYKGFKKGLVCRGKQYAENTVFVEDKAEICESGMHFCEAPFDVWEHYPPCDENGNLNEFAEHYECKGNLFCRVGIKSETGEWIWKSDCGAESYTEKEKGEASDSFKRACFNWGIGRELYTAPFIWVPSDDKHKFVEIVTGKNGQPTTYDKFIVEKITIQDGVIKQISIINQTMTLKQKNIIRAFVKVGTSNG